MNLVSKRTEDEETQDGGEQLSGEKLNRKRHDAPHRKQQACDNGASHHKFPPGQHDHGGVGVAHLHAIIKSPRDDSAATDKIGPSDKNVRK